MTTKLSAYLVYSSLAFGALLFAERLLLPGQAQTMPSIKRMGISVNEMVYDPISKKIYASVPSSAGTSGNSITVIDPVTATAGPSVFIGSEPNKLAVSDDGKYLYVGLDGARAVRRFNIQTLSPEIQLPLGNNPFGEPLLAADIAVMPGCSETVLVARSTSSVSGGGTIAIYDNGVQRRPGELLTLSQRAFLGRSATFRPTLLSSLTPHRARSFFSEWHRIFLPAIRPTG